MGVLRDGPASALFSPVRIRGNHRFSDLKGKTFSRELAEAFPNAHRGKSVAWGIPFHIEQALVVRGTIIETKIAPTKASWFVFMHTSDVRPDKPNEHGFISPMHGIGKLGEHAADYVFVYADGSEERVAIRRRHEVGTLVPRWGENCTACVPAKKQKPIDENIAEPYGGEPFSKRWGQGQTRNAAEDRRPWNNFLWAYENPYPQKSVVALRFEPRNGTVIISGISAGKVASFPLRWERRRKAVLTLPKRAGFDYDLDDNGLLEQIQLDLGQVISARPRLVYPNRGWAGTRQNLQPVLCFNEVVIEYAAHPEASFHLANDKYIPVAKLSGPGSKRAWSFAPVRSADQRVSVRVIERKSKQPVPVKLHVHGAAGEYLAPDRSSSNPQPGLVRGLQHRPVSRQPPVRLYPRRDGHGFTPRQCLSGGHQRVRGETGTPGGQSHPRDRDHHYRARQGVALARAGLGERRYPRAFLVTRDRHARGGGRGR